MPLPRSSGNSSKLGLPAFSTHAPAYQSPYKKPTCFGARMLLPLEAAVDVSSTRELEDLIIEAGRCTIAAALTMRSFIEVCTPEQ